MFIRVCAASVLFLVFVLSAIPAPAQDILPDQTIAVLDGHSALAVLGSDTAVDLLFTDIAMDGGMDGIELAHRALAIRPSLPILFTSGHAEEHQQRLAEIEALLLRKPYRKKALAAHLRQALDGAA